MDNLQKNFLLKDNINKLSKFANDAGFAEISKATRKIISDTKKHAFTVAVVGEFSRGKSTLINMLLGEDVLPIGDLPTTAMLTSIKYGEEKNIRVFNNSGEQIGEFPFSEDSWDNICNNKSSAELANEKAVVSFNSSWLKENEIEIFDTPGAGDLEEERAKVIGDALLSCDGAIIAIAATSPLSLSEKLFIEQRLIMHKVPFLMLVITKLDLVKENERDGIINYIKSKLQTLKTEIPIFIADKNTIPQDFDMNFVGIEKIKEQIVSWKNNHERLNLINLSMAAKAFYFSKSLLDSLKEKKSYVDKDDNEIKKAIEAKKLQILQTSLEWENLRLKLDEKADECTDWLLKQMSAYKDDLIESLRVSMYQTDDLNNWAAKTYPNKVRLELTTIASNLSSDLKSRFYSDKKWFNDELQKQFNVQVQKDIIFKSIDLEQTNADYFKDIIDNKKGNESKKTMQNLGVIAISLGLWIFTPIPPVISVLGGKLLSDYFVNKISAKTNINSQREIIWKAILDEIPSVINNATSPTRDRIKTIYKNLASESEELEKVWKDTQQQFIDQLSNKVKTSGIDICVNILDIENLQKQFQAFLAK